MEDPHKKQVEKGIKKLKKMGVYKVPMPIVPQNNIVVSEPKRHPYGTTPEGLIDEVRVELEKEYRDDDGMGWMPPLVQRLEDAEIEARRRWPEHFKRSPVGRVKC